MYIFINTRTNKRIITDCFREDAPFTLMEDLDNDVILAFSTASAAIKMYKFHHNSYGGDSNAVENIGEVRIDMLLGNLNWTHPIEDVEITKHLDDQENYKKKQ